MVHSLHRWVDHNHTFLKVGYTPTRTYTHTHAHPQEKEKKSNYHNQLKRESVRQQRKSF